jgi:hypothetical protein
MINSHISHALVGFSLILRARILKKGRAIKQLQPEIHGFTETVN